MASIDDVFDRNMSSAPLKLYDAITALVLDDVAEDCKRRKISYVRDPIRECAFFEKRIKSMYYDPLFETKKAMLDIFKKNGILFRLYDIHAVMEDPFKLGFVWNTSIGDVLLTCHFHTDSSVIPVSYRHALIQGEDIIKGDDQPSVYHTFEEEFQPWFVKALRSN